MAASAMKVLQVTREDHADKRYGLGRSVLQLNQGLQRAGVVTGYLCSGDLPAAARTAAAARAQFWNASLGLSMQPLLEMVSLAWETGAEAADEVQRGGYTHAHFHDAVLAHGYLSRAGADAAPYLVTQHSFHSAGVSLDRYIVPLPALLRGIIDAAERLVLHRARGSIFPTALGAAQVARDLGLTRVPAHWQVLPHGRPGWAQPSRAEARLQLGWGADERVVLAVGQIIPLKRFEWLVRAMASAPPGWRLVILGDGDASSLYRAAEQAGVAPPCIRSTDDPRPYYAAADIFASASATESFGMAHLEAMLAGLPIVCTAVGGVPEVVADAALRIDDDERAFGEGLHALFADPLLRAEYAQRALDRGAHWPDLDDVAQRYLRFYGGDPRGDSIG